MDLNKNDRWVEQLSCILLCSNLPYCNEVILQKKAAQSLRLPCTPEIYAYLLEHNLLEHIYLSITTTVFRAQY